MNTLIEQLSKETHECMVCYDTVKRRAETWSCHTCYAVFHLSCIKKWASKSTDRELPPAPFGFPLFLNRILSFSPCRGRLEMSWMPEGGRRGPEGVPVLLWPDP